MLANEINHAIDELWALKITPSNLYNIERVPQDKPKKGGGHTYIQISMTQVDDLLKFLRKPYPEGKQPIIIHVGNQQTPNAEPEELEFWSKSADRMRIARQNRCSQNRLSAWSPQYGFPKLKAFEGTNIARGLLKDIGQLHIYLVRTSDGKIWAGYTKGKPSEEDLQQPFADLLWGQSKGGYWSFKEEV